MGPPLPPMGSGTARSTISGIYRFSSQVDRLLVYLVVREIRASSCEISRMVYAIANLDQALAGCH